MIKLRAYVRIVYLFSYFEREMLNFIGEYLFNPYMVSLTCHEVYFFLADINRGAMIFKGGTPII